MLAALPAIISGASSIYSAIKGNQKEKEAKKQSAKAQGLAVQADAEAKRIAGERYQALDPFRNAAMAELARSNTIRPETYAAVTGGKYQKAQDAALAQATQGLDRIAMTRQALGDYDSANARGLNERFRAVGSNAAKFGRLGMQVNEQNVKDVANQYEQDRMRFANDLIRNANEATVGDRYRALDATSGLNAQDIGLQERNRQFDYGTKRDAVGDRNNALSQAQNLAGFGFNNNQVLDASSNANTRGALGDASAQNRQAAGQYGQGAVDAAGAAGRFLALPATNKSLALDPNLLNYAGNVATNVKIPGL